MVNLSILEQYGKAAVFCESEEQAKMFVDAMWDQYPNKVKSAWVRGSTNWSNNSDGIYYLPRLFHDVGEGEYRHMQSSSLSWATAHGYSVVPFGTLIEGFDLGEIQVDDSMIESLLHEIGV